MLIVFVFLESKLVYYKCNFCENIYSQFLFFMNFSGFRHAAQPNIYQIDKISVDAYIFCCQMAEITCLESFMEKFPTGEYLSDGRMIF